MPMHPGTSFPGGTDWEVALSSTIKSAASGLEATAKVLLVGLRNLVFSSDQQSHATEDRIDRRLLM